MILMIVFPVLKKINYDKKGNLMQWVSKRIDEPFHIKNEFKCDEDYKLKEALNYENGKLKSELVYKSKNEMTQRILFANDINNSWLE